MTGLITVRRSELETFRQCPLKHKLQWVERWRPAHDSDASSLGTDWHLVLAWHYGVIQEFQLEKRKLSMQVLSDTVTERIDGTWLQEDPGRWSKLRWMYEGYLDYWGTDPHWRIEAVEETQRVRLLDQDERQTRFMLEWTTDLRVFDQELNAHVVVDHKSTKQPLGKTDIDLDDQYGTYTLAERRMGRPVLMQIANQAKTEKLKRPMTLQERFTRINGFRTDRELRAIELDLLGVAEAAHPQTPRRLYSSPDPRTCGWKCDVMDVHLALRKGALGMDQLATVMKMHGMVQREAPSGTATDPRNR